MLSLMLQDKDVTLSRAMDLPEVIKEFGIRNIIYSV